MDDGSMWPEGLKGYRRLSWRTRAKLALRAYANVSKSPRRAATVFWAPLEMVVCVAMSLLGIVGWAALAEEIVGAGYTPEFLKSRAPWSYLSYLSEHGMLASLASMAALYGMVVLSGAIAGMRAEPALKKAESGRGGVFETIYKWSRATVWRWRESERGFMGALSASHGQLMLEAMGEAGVFLRAELDELGAAASPGAAGISARKRL
jgi:hypothetical protein